MTYKHQLQEAERKALQAQAMFIIALLCILAAVIVIYILVNQIDHMRTMDQPEAINLMTCIALLDDGQLTHISQQQTCSKIIRKILPTP